MLTCITCSKQRVEDGEEGPPPNTKDAVKTLTTQVLPLLIQPTSFCIYTVYTHTHKLN